MKKYRVDSIEHGERFFFMLETDKQTRREIDQEARDSAQGWGAEVISIDWNGAEIINEDTEWTADDELNAQICEATDGACSLSHTGYGNE